MKKRKIVHVYKHFLRLGDQVKIPFRRQHSYEGFMARRDKSWFASESAMGNLNNMSAICPHCDGVMYLADDESISVNYYCEICNELFAEWEVLKDSDLSEGEFE